MPLSKRLSAEFIGTLWLVLGGCGSAVLATAYPSLGIGFAGVALAFGLTVLTGAYALGHISGAHFNPAVSFGLWAGKRFPGNELLPYIIAQVLGALAGAGIIYLIATGKVGFSVAAGFASNGFGDSPGSPGNYTALAAFVAEVVMTFFFLIVILGSTHRLAPRGFAPLAIGLCLTLIHLVTIPVTNTSVNPARSTGPAIFVALVGDSWAIEQLWLFWVAPILGALLAGFVFLWLSGDDEPAAAAAVDAGDSGGAVDEGSDGNGGDGDGGDGGGNGGGGD
jgi:aquaporin Z